MATHSFICNCCTSFNKNEEVCEQCNGQGTKFQPINEELYKTDPQEFAKGMILTIRSELDEL